MGGSMDIVNISTLTIFLEMCLAEGDCEQRRVLITDTAKNVITIQLLSAKNSATPV